MNLLTDSETTPALAPIPAGAEPVILIENVSVRYRIPRERVSSIKDYAIRKVKGRIVFDEFWALRGVSLEVRRGETMGIIGHNGAGKSTLLKLVARVLRPSAGRVRVKGRVAPLLELGAGFDYELTGRENVFLNGTILGFRAADIALRFERLYSKDVPIEPRYAKAAPQGYSVVGNRFDPPKVRIRGPEQRLQTIDHVTTDPIDLSGLVSQTSQRVRVRIGEPRVRLESNAQVRITLELRKFPPKESQ